MLLHLKLKIPKSREKSKSKRKRDHNNFIGYVITCVVVIVVLNIFSHSKSLLFYLPIKVEVKITVQAFKAKGKLECSKLTIITFTSISFGAVGNHMRKLVEPSVWQNQWNKHKRMRMPINCMHPSELETWPNIELRDTSNMQRMIAINTVIKPLLWI